MSHVGIIGGGIIGLSSAYYLNKEGFEVTIFDQGDLKVGCSTGNAGMIVPSHIIPLASPGMIAKGIRWMFDSKSPFYVRPRFSKDLVKWGYQFIRHANKEHVEYSIPALKSISVFSKSMVQQLAAELPFDFGYHERGLLMLYRREESEKEEIETAHIANKAGIEARVLSPAEIQRLEPDVRVAARGGVFYPGDAHLSPQVLMENLILLLKERGVQFRSNTVITEFETNKNRITGLNSSEANFQLDMLVVAAGAWSGKLISKLGVSLPMQAGKGYSFTVRDIEKNTRIPTIFLGERVAVTPMGKDLRFGGTMEISGVDHAVNMRRVRGIYESISNYYPDMKVMMPEPEHVWHGLRPCSPDGLPYIGRSGRYNNLIIATGHSMMGLSLGPGTGKLVCEIAQEERTSISLAPFNPERYDR